MDLTTLFLICFLVLIGYFTFTEYLKHKRSTAQRDITEERKRQEKVDLEGALDGLPTALQQAKQIYAEQVRAMGDKPDPKVLKPMEDRIRQMEWVQQNEWWIRSAAPYIDRVAQTLFKMFK